MLELEVLAGSLRKIAGGGLGWDGTSVAWAGAWIWAGVKSGGCSSDSFLPGASGAESSPFAIAGCSSDSLFSAPSGAGSCAFAMATAGCCSGEPARRSWIRRSTLVPHQAQNVCRSSFSCPQDWHRKVTPPWPSLLSTLRRSKETPHIPQNLLSGRFSIPQKVQSIGSLLPPRTPASKTNCFQRQPRYEDNT